MRVNLEGFIHYNFLILTIRNVAAKYIERPVIATLPTDNYGGELFTFQSLYRPIELLY
jgi:hypothetical protein